MPPNLIAECADVYRQYINLKESRIVLLFKGAVSQDTLVELGSLMLNPAKETVEENLMRKLFAILVEMAQNILHYSLEREFKAQLGRDVGVGVIIVEESEEEFIISSGNMVSGEAEILIRERCLHINSLSKEALREFYLKTRKQERSPEKKGAGLGLIDIARKSGHPLQFDFHAMEGGKAFFSLVARVDKVLAGGTH
jgi:hypothetical protein